MYPKNRTKESEWKNPFHAFSTPSKFFLRSHLYNNLHLSNDWEGSSNLLVHHKSKDAHHGSTSVVQLNSPLLQLFLVIPLIPSSLKSTITQISRELCALSPVAHERNLQNTNEDEDLLHTLLRDGIVAKDGRQSIGEGAVRISRLVDGSVEVLSVTRHNLAQEGELGDAAVLHLNVTKAVESFLICAVEHAEGIPESEWGLGAEFGFEGVEGSGGLSGLGGSEGGDGADEGGGDKGGRLHDWMVDVNDIEIVSRRIL
mmetsp:Transcript_25576/g.40237  ORF Transcript_25576/g.40237 Transcript_25576/m.40237 type:complete len:257 (+) Transcript_25576:154-924(+)